MKDFHLQHHSQIWMLILLELNSQYQMQKGIKYLDDKVQWAQAR